MEQSTLFLNGGGIMRYTMNGYVWNVYLVPPHNKMLMRPDGSFTCGMCDRDTQCVYLSNLLRGAFLRKVLIHEVCHSAMMSYDVNMSVEQEELFCDLLATFGDEIISVADDMFRVLKSSVA